MQQVQHFKVYTYRERPELLEQTNSFGDLWPELIFHTEAARKYYNHVWNTFADFNFFLVDEADVVVAAGIAMPLVWDGSVEGLPDGWDDVLEKAVQHHEQQRQPNTLCALAAVVDQRLQGQGLSRHVILAMKTLAAQHGLDALIAPVRPTKKSQYPLTPIERYIEWTAEDGSPFDPWMRVHWRIGGQMLKAAPKSMVIQGTVEQFEKWCGMAFPESGVYVVPRILSSVVIDREADACLYEEPNVWFLHKVSEK